MKVPLLLLALVPGIFSHAEETELFTNVFVVPPSFVALQAERRPSAREILFQAGIDFPEGASAVYNATTSQLIVRTTQDRMALVEQYVDSLRGQVEMQVYLTIRELDFPQKPKFFEMAELVGPSAKDPGKSARVFVDREPFLEALSQPPRTDFPATTVTRRGVAGVFTDPQFQVMIRAARNELGLKEIPASSVMVRSGQHALLQDGQKRWGVVPVLGADNATIDLEFYIPEPGEPFFLEGPGSRNPDQVTMEDRRTLTWAEERKDGSWRMVFISAILIDPAGRPVNEVEKEKASGK